MAGFVLGLVLIRLLPYIWPVEAYSLQPLVQANLLAKPTNPAVNFLLLSLGLAVPHAY